MTVVALCDLATVLLPCQQMEVPNLLADTVVEPAPGECGRQSCSCCVKMSVVCVAKLVM